MSAFVVDRVHIDLMVSAAVQYGGREGLQWWQTDEAGAYAGWWKLGTGADREGYMRHVSTDGLGQMLIMENVASVGYRYSEPGRTYYYGADGAAELGEDTAVLDLPGPCDRYYVEPYTYTAPGYRLTPGDVAKLIGCYGYQSCEHPGWYTSDVFRFCEALKDAALDSLPCDLGWDVTARGLAELKAKHPERVDNTRPIFEL